MAFGNPPAGTELTSLANVNLVSLWHGARRRYPGILPQAIAERVARHVSAPTESPEHVVQVLTGVMQVACDFGIDPLTLNHDPTKLLRQQYDAAWESGRKLSGGFNVGIRLPDETVQPDEAVSSQPARLQVQVPKVQLPQGSEIVPTTRKRLFDVD